MSINPKTGNCIDCCGNEQKYIMAGRCISAPYFHYQKHKQALYNKRQSSKKKAKTLRTVAKGGMSLGQWFNVQISMMPSECENCNAYLNPYAPWSARAYIAHIVPKRYFESVMVHPMNRLFLCIDCHSNYDNWLSKEVEQMRCWSIAVGRFKLFKNEIPTTEHKHLRGSLNDLL